jgi:hypothetical protein
MESGVNRHEAAAGKTKKQYDITVPIPESLRDIGNTEILSTVIKKLKAADSFAYYFLCVLFC